MSRARTAAALAAAASLAACASFPPQGGGGSAERAMASGAAARPAAEGDIDDAWIEARLETISCLDFRLEGLAQAGAAALYPAEIALARADRRRALRALTGGLPQDGELNLRDYRDRVRRIEEALLRTGRPVSAETRNLPC